MTCAGGEAMKTCFFLSLAAHFVRPRLAGMLVNAAWQRICDFHRCLQGRRDLRRCERQGGWHCWVHGAGCGGRFWDSETFCYWKTGRLALLGGLWAAGWTLLGLIGPFPFSPGSKEPQIQLSPSVSNRPINKGAKFCDKSFSIIFYFIWLTG